MMQMPLPSSSEETISQAPSVYSYEDTTVEQSKMYDYRIRAETGFGFG